MSFEMSFSRLFVHHEWISIPASRVMAEVCWKSLNLSRGNPNCLSGRAGLVVITFALSVWFGFVSLRADSPVVLLESLESSIAIFPWPWHYDSATHQSTSVEQRLLCSSSCSTLSSFWLEGFVLAVTLITVEGGGTSSSWPLDGEEMNVNNWAVMEEKLGNQAALRLRGISTWTEVPVKEPLIVRLWTKVLKVICRKQGNLLRASWRIKGWENPKKQRSNEENGGSCCWANQDLSKKDFFFYSLIKQEVSNWTKEA